MSNETLINTGYKSTHSEFPWFDPNRPLMSTDTISKFNISSLGGFSIVTNLIFIKVNNRLTKEMEKFQVELRQKVRDEIKEELKKEIFQELLEQLQLVIKKQLKERLDSEREEWII